LAQVCCIHKSIVLAQVHCFGTSPLYWHKSTVCGTSPLYWHKSTVLAQVHKSTVLAQVHCIGTSLLYPQVHCIGTSPLYWHKSTVSAQVHRMWHKSTVLAQVHCIGTRPQVHCIGTSPLYWHKSTVLAHVHKSTVLVQVHCIGTSPPYWHKFAVFTSPLYLHKSTVLAQVQCTGISSVVSTSPLYLTQKYDYVVPVLQYGLKRPISSNHNSLYISALSDPIQTIITGPRQSFQSYRTRYKHTSPVLDILFSLIELDTNNPYRSSTILSALSDSIPTNFTGPRQSFQPYRTRYKQTDECFNERFDERCSRGKRKVFSASFQSIAS
jgi:hypothetical protein